MDESLAATDCESFEVLGRRLVMELRALDTEESEQMWRFDITRGGKSFTSCAGIPSDDGCRLEVTCSGELDELHSGDYVLALDLDAGELSGSGVLMVNRDEQTCRAQLDLSGTRAEVREPSNGA